MKTALLARMGGLALMLGGAVWVLGSGGIILGGPWWLEWGLAGALLFPVGLLGLYGAFHGRGGRLAAVGLWLLLIAICSVVLMFVGVGWLASADYDIFSLGGGAATVLGVTSLAFVVGSIALIGGVLALGLAAGRAKVMSPAWRLLLLALVVLAVPQVVVDVTAQSLEERFGPLMQVPIVVQGAAWMTLGYRIWSSAGAKAKRTSQTV